jgi:hypothetical protein
MMKRNGFGVVWVGLLLATGCGSGVQVGLSNAPSANHPSRRRAPHDVLANGPESCNAANSSNADPLRYRVPPCQSEEQHGTPQIVAQP